MIIIRIRTSSPVVSGTCFNVISLEMRTRRVAKCRKIDLNVNMDPDMEHNQTARGGGKA